MDIYLATGNAHKAEELQKLLDSAGLNVNVYSAKEAGGMPEVEETEDNYEGNARLKAMALQALLPEEAWVLGDDSGISVDALEGAPGVRSARYAGPDATDEDNYTKVLKLLVKVPRGKRGGSFNCCLVLRNKEMGEAVFLSTIKGDIIEEPRGDNGFGYDPIFIPRGSTKTCAEMLADEKDQVSHRGRAVRQLIEWLREQ